MDMIKWSQQFSMERSDIIPVTNETYDTNWLLVEWRLELDLVGRTTVRSPATPIGRGLESNHPELLS
ncbi:hypothetical protein CsSME_00048339 [Camellia sinensis var. sinensis]